MTLYDPARHVQLPASDWDPARVEKWLGRWASDALAVRERGGWPLHPRDVEGADMPAPPQCLYFGAGGVWLALARLDAAGFCPLPGALDDILDGVLDMYEKHPDTGERVPSWFVGESALLTMCLLARPDAAKVGRLATRIRDNRDNPAREALWGAPGTMIAALVLYEATGHALWAELYRDSAAALWASWQFDEAAGTWLWEQDLGGNRIRYVGAGHGWAGNLYALWRGQELLSEEQRAQLHERTVQGLERLAVVEDDVANWLPEFGARDKRLVQWCHGAPGILTSLRYAAIPEALPLLLKGATLTLRAGPLSKGVALCHGTAGNGAALLAMYRRTGDTAWRERAHEFAMFALDQAEADFSKYGQWHHSLWTGDAGLACFLLDCLEGRDRGLPGLDSFW